MNRRWTWPEPMPYSTSVIITSSIAIITDGAADKEIILSD
jgi:hypothetical protein